MSEVIVGVDLGGTKILAGLVTLDGHIRSVVKEPTRVEDGPEAIMDRISVIITQLLKQVPASDHLAGIGVAAPGPLYFPAGIISTTPNLGWNNLNLKQGLSSRLNRNVLVDNDANLAAWGEAYYGQNNRYRNLLYLTVSTGVGGGAVINGEIYRGRNGGAGEFGHMVIDPRGPVCRCGRHGCLEAMASGTALSQEAIKLLQQGGGLRIKEYAADPERPTAEEISRAAGDGDPEARILVSRLITNLGVGISNLINIFNPEIVVLGGGVALGMGNALLEPLTDYISKHTFSLHSAHLPVVLSALDANAGLLGCAAAIKEELD